MNEFLAEFASVVWVTLSYLGVYYVIITYGLIAKRRAARRCKSLGERFDRYNSQDPELLAADRMQLNTLEHMPPFIVFLWLQAAVVSAESATVLGALYVMIRATYPFFLGRELSSSLPRRVLINTFSGYLVMVAFAGSQLYELLG